MQIRKQGNEVQHIAVEIEMWLMIIQDTDWLDSKEQVHVDSQKFQMLTL